MWLDNIKDWTPVVDIHGSTYDWRQWRKVHPNDSDRLGQGIDDDEDGKQQRQQQLNTSASGGSSIVTREEKREITEHISA